MSPKQSGIGHPDPGQLLHYDSKYQVIICKPCKYAIQPAAVSRHLKDIHHILCGARLPYLDFVGGLDLTTQVPEAAKEDFPVAHLALYTGFKCEAPRCDYLCLSAKRMEMHWPAVHKCKGEAARDWSRVPLQTFYQGTMLRYFVGPRKVPSRKIPNPTETHGHCHEAVPWKDQLRQSCQLDELDSMILEHYFAISHQSFLIGPEAQHVWLHVVPQLALRHDFVLQGILCFTGQHMLHLQHPQSSALVIRAASHKELAFPAFRQALENPTKDNCDAILVFACILLVLSLGGEANATKPDERDPLLLVRASDSDSRVILPQWLQLLRSGCAMLGPCWQYIKAGPINPLLKGLHPGPVQNEVSQFHLGRFLSATSATPHMWPDDVVNIYTAAARELATAFASADLYSDASRSEFIRTFNVLALFPLRVNEQFLALLASGHPAALILTAHYCMLLKQLDKYWYFTGRAERLLTEIEGMLEPQWLPYIQDAAALVRSDNLSLGNTSDA
ncbi:hypothetical protein CC79DRAFT_1399924 [Sarocladium strictum]